MSDVPLLEAKPSAVKVESDSACEDNTVPTIDGLDGIASTKSLTPETTGPPVNKPMFMLANLAVGGQWPGAPDASTRFPATYEIDYIRAYRFAR